MRRILITLFVGLACLVAGLLFGAWQSAQLKSTKAGQWIAATASKVPWTKSGDQSSDDNQFESYNYPTVKWRPKPLPDASDSAVQLWTTYEAGPKNAPQGLMKYKLTLFKATNKDQREVQMLDAMGFKIVQFSANDFHVLPGSTTIVEARDSVSCSEDQYKKARDYSVK
jgi:hypothetical protein